MDWITILLTSVLAASPEEWLCLVRHKLLRLLSWLMSRMLPRAAGAGVAAATDLTFSLYGYTAVVLNDFLTALHLVLGYKLGSQHPRPDQSTVRGRRGSCCRNRPNLQPVRLHGGGAERLFDCALPHPGQELAGVVGPDHHRAAVLQRGAVAAAAGRRRGAFRRARGHPGLPRQAQPRLPGALQVLPRLPRPMWRQSVQVAALHNASMQLL